MNSILVLLSVIVVFLGSAASVLAQVNLPNPLGTGISSFTGLLSSIATYIFGIVGALAVIMFIWAGILYLTSGMNPGNVQKANKAVLYAIIGLAIAIAGVGLIQLICTILGATCPVI